MHVEKLSWEMDTSRPPPEALPAYEDFEPTHGGSSLGNGSAPSASATGYDESDSFGPLEPRQGSELRPEQHNDDDDGVEEEEEEEEVTEC